ncbi:bifunctional 5,10-methylene-tetrahydrofolate dehydrogenase/5,10-methylene-tetrahydrofolate cyclohydrolase [bacterium]|nr:bifunctional 5,10-methylene-tetrahydrofolate dehydrogenase/5,10-methylene-tetrahydrofolate cyclohydrolase [bacterium]
MTQIISGKTISKEIKAELKQEIEQLKAAGVTPNLTVILVGTDPASQSYVRGKGRACKKLGMASETILLPETTQQDELLTLIAKLADDSSVHGILVQLPLPKHIDEKVVIAAIPAYKDVDGFHPVNKGKLLAGEETFLPCTPAGIQEMLVRSGNDPKGKHVVIVGRSQIVGMPMAAMLMQKKAGANATVTVCHTGTPDIAYFTRQADIVIAAVGRPEVITGDMLKEGCVVIDVGVNRVAAPETEKGYRLVGDVDFASAERVAAAISPVPGGVGPMTITMLLKNTVVAARNTLPR